MVHLRANKFCTAAELELVFEILRDALVPDGSLRDIYVLNTSAVEWQRFLNWLHTGLYRTDYRYGEDFNSVPRDPEELFNRKAQTHLIRIDLGDLWLHCHCFSLDEIELDLDPAEAGCPGQVEKLLRFLAALATAVNRDVIVAPENFKEGLFLCMHSNRDLGARSSILKSLN